MTQTSLKLLIAGDASHAGKSTASLGVLASLLHLGYKPNDIAYIKPATQCVASTLTARFCADKGIACEHIGPVVFYRGYTRLCLDEPNAPGALVRRCADAVERISAGKLITVIDGVGYPSVGSIVGCSSSDIAVACGSPVLFVGRPGVGDAIDSFNLCASYFELQRVPVLGVIFNRLSPAGFYSRDKCGAYARKYMALHRPMQRVYGVLPKDDALAACAGEETCGFAFSHPEVPEHPGELSEDDKKAVDVVGELFRSNVDMDALVNDLRAASEEPHKWARTGLAVYPGAGPADRDA